MTSSPARIAANQANAQKSCGPKTEAGKAISRGNAIKHGLTGEGIALPDEDAELVEAAYNQHFDEMKPKTRAGAAIVYQVALATLRLTRFRIANTAITSQRILDAGGVFDDAQVARRDEAKAKLHKDPAAQLAVLSRFSVGAQWVIDAWNALGCALASGTVKNWRQAQYDLFEALMGRSTEFPSYDDTTFWSLAAMGDATVLDDTEMFAGNSPAARCQDARNKLIEVADREIERWEAILETATASTATARDNAIKAARHDTSKEGQLASKYEAATTRALNKALKDFKVVEAEFAEPEPAVETPEEVTPCDELGSFFPEVEPEPVSADRECPEPGSLTIPATQTPQVPTHDPRVSLPTSIRDANAGEIPRP